MFYKEGMEGGRGANAAVIFLVWAHSAETTNERHHSRHLFIGKTRCNQMMSWWAPRCCTNKWGSQRHKHTALLEAASVYWHFAAACDEEPAEGTQRKFKFGLHSKQRDPTVRLLKPTEFKLVRYCRLLNGFGWEILIEKLFFFTPGTLTAKITKYMSYF